MTKRTYNNDYNFGKQGEIEVNPILNTFFNTTMIHQKERYALYDFISSDNNIYVELKNRNCNSNTYKTIWINHNKVLTAKEGKRSNPARRYFFAFKCYDGIFYIEYDEALFDTFTENYFQRQDRDIIQKEVHLIDVPTEKLIKIIC